MRRASRLAIVAPLALAACVAIPVLSWWGVVAVDPPWWAALLVVAAAMVGTALAATMAVRNAGERDRAQVRASAERERAEIHRIHRGEQ